MGVAVALTAVGMVMGHSAQRKQAKAQRKQEDAARASAKAQQRIADIRAKQNRLAAAKEQRRTLAAQQNISASSSITSSGSAGFIGSIQSQYANALSTSNQISSIARQNSIFNQQASAQASNLYGSAAKWEGLADLTTGASTIFSLFDTKGASDMFRT